MRPAARAPPTPVLPVVVKTHSYEVGGKSIKDHEKSQIDER